MSITILVMVMCALKKKGGFNVGRFFCLINPYESGEPITINPIGATTESDALEVIETHYKKKGLDCWVITENDLRRLMSESQKVLK